MIRMEMKSEMTIGKEKKSNRYFESISKRNWMTWIISVVTAFALNLVLFLFMPHLMVQNPDIVILEEAVSSVNVIRVKRKEKPVKPKPEKPHKPPEKIKKVKQPVSRPERQKISPELSLPFEINPRLPAGPATLNLPPVESVPMEMDVQTGDMFSMEDLDAPLTTLARIPPVYPLRAKRRGIEGWVKVEFMVDEKGDVSQVNILGAVPEGMFEESVIRCVKSWKFKPGTIGGFPVKTRAETVIRFELEG